MSWQANTWVVQNSKHKGSTYLTLLIISNHAHSDGTGAYPTVATLAAETRLSERQIRRIIEVLEESGELTAERDAGPKGATLYSLPLMQSSLADKMSGTGKEPLRTSEPPLADISGALPDKSRPPHPLIERVKEGKKEELPQTHPFPIETVNGFVAAFVEAYQETHGKRSPESKFKAQIGRQVKSSLAEGKAPDVVLRAVVRAARENKFGILSHLIADEEGGVRPGRTRKMTGTEAVEEAKRRWGND